jgi:hypothetical protein
MDEIRREEGRHKREETERGRKKRITEEENERLEDRQKTITGAE